MSVCLVTHVYELPECGVFAGVVPRSGVLAVVCPPSQGPDML